LLYCSHGAAPWSGFGPASEQQIEFGIFVNDWDDWDEEDQQAMWHETSAPCPHCGTEIYDDAERCPACETYISWNQGPLSGRSRRWVLLCRWGVALALAGILGVTLLPLILPLLLGG
jgi:hypothetical protein